MKTFFDSARMLGLNDGAKRSRVNAPSPSGRVLASGARGLGAAALLILAGCASSGGGSKVTQALSPAEFRTGPAEHAAPAQGGVPAVAPEVAASTRQPVAPKPPAPAAVPIGDSGNGRVVAVVGDAPQPAAAAQPVGRDSVADSMVGQIQGRPVYASEVLDPLYGRLHELSKKVAAPQDLPDWVDKSIELIAGIVKERVKDELLLGEARSRLSADERIGLIHFIQRIDQWASGQSGGSRAQAEDEIKSRQGVDYDAYLQKQRDQVLIQELIKANVSPNVRVPWRRVERFYAENQATVNPPPYGVVRILMLDAPDAETIAKAQAAATAADGTAYHELAASAANRVNGRKDFQSQQEIRVGLVVRALDKPFEQLRWVQNPEWNKLAANLQPNQAAGPIDAGGDKVWIRREADVTSTFRSLEEAQLEIYARLLQQKDIQEQSEFFGELLGKGSFTPIRQMTLELVVLAAQRHLKPEVAGAVRAAFPQEQGAGKGLERSPALPVLDDFSVAPSKPKGDTPSPAAPK
jgi:hypothetical protein